VAGCVVVVRSVGNEELFYYDFFGANLVFVRRRKKEDEWKEKVMPIISLAEDQGTHAMHRQIGMSSHRPIESRPPYIDHPINSPFSC